MRAIEQNFYYYLNSYPVELLDYADKAIEGLYKHDEVIIGLSTGNIKSIGLSKIKYTGIDNFFSFGSFGNEVFDRYQLLKLTKKRLTRDFDYSISDVAMHVGDSTLDILSAKKSGFVPIGVTTGSCSEQELYKAGAKFVFNNLRELNNSFDSVLEIIQQKKNIENLIPVK
jgi:phosphoglycolate phosphatase-like HAD superfamily hydrolase